MRKKLCMSVFMGACAGLMGACAGTPTPKPEAQPVDQERAVPGGADRSHGNRRLVEVTPKQPDGRFRKEENVYRGGHRFGFVRTPLTPFAEAIAAMAEAAMTSAPMPTSPFTARSLALKYEDKRPVGRLTWKLFYAEVDFIAKTQSGEHKKFRTGMVLGPEGLKLVEADVEAHEYDPADVEPSVPAAISASVSWVLDTTDAGHAGALIMGEASLLFIQDAKQRQELLGRGFRNPREFAAAAASVESVLGFMLDDLGLLAVDEEGRVYSVEADVDVENGTFAFDDQYLFRVRPVP